MKKIVISVVSIFVFAFFMLFASSCSESQVKEKKTKTEQNSDLDKEIQNVADEFNKQLPMRADRITMLTKMEYSKNRELRLLYTMTIEDPSYIKAFKENFDNFPEEKKDALKRQILKGMKNLKGFEKIKKHGIIISYECYDSAGNLLAMFKIDPNSYD